MMDMRVSVIIPAYKCAETITQAINSALRQESILEILVISDNPDDELDLIMTQYIGESKVVYLKNEKNMGAAATRNRGVCLAKGEYVAFLDADDYWADGKIKSQLERLEVTDTVLCCTARELMTPAGALTGRIIPVKPIIRYRDLLKHNSISCSSVLMRRNIAREFPMHHEDSHEDYIMWLEILKKYQTACGVNEPMLKYRVSSRGKSGSKLHSAHMTFKVYRYMGFSMLQSIICFISYAIHGVIKHYFLR